MIGIKEMVGVCCCVLFSHVGFSQVKMNTNFATGNMNSNTAFLDGSSSNSWNGSSNLGKGLLFPRVDLTTLAAMSMAGSPSASNNPNRFDGMLVYNTGVGTSAIGSISVTAGFYYYKNSTADIDGGTWQPMSAMDLAGDISSIAGITTIGDGKVTDSKVASGINASKVGLGNVDNTSDRNKPISDATQTALDTKGSSSAMALKAPLASPVFTGAPSAPTATFGDSGTTVATTAFVSSAVASSAIASATTSIEGKIQLAGDLTGTSALPEIGSNKITSDKIADGTILGADISDGGIDLATDKVGGILSATKGGTGAASLTGFVVANGTAAFSTVSKFSASDVSGVVRSVNGSSPDSDGKVTVSFGSVSTGILSARPAGASSVNGNIYVVSSDSNTDDNGRTFISDGASWNEVTSNQAATDSRYVKLEGGSMQGDLTFPTGKMGYVIDAPQGSTDIANKQYVDQTIVAGTPDAATSTKGKIQLAGDLAGTSAAPTVPGLVLKAPLASPNFTGTVTGVTSTMVGLGNVDNTSDADKSISDATQTALDAKGSSSDMALKAPLASPAFTGTPSAPTALFGDAGTTLATTGFVASAVSGSTIPSATTSTEGKIKLAGDLAGTAALPTVPGLALKANISSPSFTGTVSGVTATMVGLGNVDNTSDLNKPISDATQTALDTKGSSSDMALKANIASPSFTGIVSGVTATMVGLGNVDNTSDRNKPISDATQTALDTKGSSSAMALKAPLASPVFTGAPSAPTATFGDSGTTVATTAFVSSAVASSAIASATTSIEGKIQLAGDLTGTSALPEIGSNKITSDKIADGTILGADISDGGIDLATDKVGGILSATKGGTGAASLTGFVVANGTAAFSTVSKFSASDVSGVVRSVNGSSPDSDGKVTVSFGSVSTGILSARPAGASSVNGNIYVVSSDSNTDDNGRTFISDGASWNEVTSNQAATDSRYVKLEGGSMQGDLTFPTGKMGYVIDAPQGSTDIANKQYVDQTIVAGTPDAATSTKGKIQLAGDLAGTSAAPTVPGLVLKAPLASPNFTGTVTGVTSTMVGLGNVDNIADVNKVISDATQIALDDKESIANKSLDINIDAASDVKFPSVKAIKTYVDATGSINAITAVTSTYSATESDYIILCNTAGSAFSLTLPAASAQVGKAYIIRKTDISANTMTISPGLMLGSTVISGVNYPITIEVVSDGTDWNIIK
jgi:hypothetical protein